MKNFLFLFILVLLSHSYTIGQPPDGYYSSAKGLKGYTLKTELKAIIDDIDNGDGSSIHVDQGYGGLWDVYQNQNSGDIDSYTTYENNNTILDIYSENPNSTDSYNFIPGNDQCGNYQDEGDCYNREHTIPQSFFNSASPMKNDYHSTFPTDGKVNKLRGSLPYGEVSTTSTTTANGSKIGPSASKAYSGDVFEPIDEFKGDIARALFYFATRYEDQLGNSNWDNANFNFLSNDKNQFYDKWVIDVLLDWHQQDPVSQKEIDRNNNGFLHQGNRNPFIDQPGYAPAIWNENFGTANFSSIAIQFSNNPVTTGRLELALQNTTSGRLYLYNISGKLIKKFQIDNKVASLPVNFLQSGVYIAQFKTDNQQLNKKLIIKN